MDIKEKKLQQIQTVPYWTAGISFTLGTVLLALHMLERDEMFLVIGFFYVAAAVISNLVVLLVMAALAYIHTEHQKQILRNTVILFANIPVAIVYFFIVFNSNQLI